MYGAIFVGMGTLNLIIYTVKFILMIGFCAFAAKIVTYKTQDIDTRQDSMYKTDFW